MKKYIILILILLGFVTSAYAFNKLQIIYIYNGSTGTTPAAVTFGGDSDVTFGGDSDITFGLE